MLTWWFAGIRDQQKMHFLSACTNLLAKHFISFISVVQVNVQDDWWVTVRHNVCRVSISSSQFWDNSRIAWQWKQIYNVINLFWQFMNTMILMLVRLIKYCLHTRCEANSFCKSLKADSILSSVRRTCELTPPTEIPPYLWKDMTKLNIS